MRYPLVSLVTRPLVVGAAFAGFALLFTLATLPSIYFLNPGFLEAVSLYSTNWFTLVCSVVALVTGVFGLSVARFGLRLVPIRFDVGVKLRAFVLGLSVLLALVSFALLAVFAPIHDDRPNASEDAWFQSSAPEEVRVAGAIAVLLFAACAVTPFVWRHMKPKAFLKQPFVLYLRRFSTFSDRSVLNEVLRACPHGKPLVFLTPTRSAIRDWNPFQIGLAGLRIRNPVRSMPIPVRADDAFWQSAVRELILSADTVVLDASEGSAAIDIETELIENLREWRKTILLRTGQNQLDTWENNEQVFEKAAQVIHYERSWRRALPRLILGPIVSIFPAMWLAVILLIVANLTVFPLVGVDLGFQQSPPRESAIIVALTVAAILTAWVYMVLFWRPAINKEAAVALENTLRKASPSSAQ